MIILGLLIISKTISERIKHSSLLVKMMTMGNLGWECVGTTHRILGVRPKKNKVVGAAIYGYRVNGGDTD
jgi:hypothetical protein